MTTSEPEALIPVGYEIAKEQFRLPIEPLARTYKVEGAALNCSDKDNLLEVNSSKVQFVFNKATGVVTSYKVNGTEYFKDGFGLQPNFGVHRLITIMVIRHPSACKSGKSRAKTSRWRKLMSERMIKMPC